MANVSGDSRRKTSSSSSQSSSSSADSYIGSIISLTSKYEIRYEGILCYLNPQDSTLCLKNVRSYGTEGRKKDGPQIPPSVKVYEYILFRGSDIQDLQVKSAPTQAEVPIHNEPAVIQSQSTSGPSSSPKLSAVGESSTESSPYMEDSTLNLRSYSNVVPSHQSGELGPSQTAQNTTFSSHTMLNPLSRYNLARKNYASARQQPIPSTTTSLPTLPNFQEVSPVQAPNNIALTSSSNSLAPMPALTASSLKHSSIMPTLTHEQLSTHANLLSSSLKSSLSSYPSIVANQLNMSMSSLHSSGQNGTRIGAPEMTNMFTHSMTLEPAQSLSYSASSLVDSASGSLKQSQSLLAPGQLSRTRLSELSPAQNAYPDHRDMGLLNSAASNSLYLSTTLAAQAPPLPLQPSTEQVTDWLSIQRSISLVHLHLYTEEFDFDAMNEKFKKDEVWGYLGKAKQRDKMERVVGNATVYEMLGKEDGDGFFADGDSKPAYNKDEFFDTISCNSTAQRTRYGQNCLPVRMRLGAEHRLLPGHGGYLSGRGHHCDPYSWGRGYTSGGRGRGGYPRWY